MSELGPGACLRCWGEGRIANSDEGEPWSTWEALPPGSDLAVRMGFVRPIDCPECGGTGIKPPAEPPFQVTEPGVFDIDEAVYHGDPVPGTGSLSSTGARALSSRRKTPAHYAWERQHGRRPKREFDYGHAAHAKVLGRGMGIEVIDAENYRTKAAQAARDEARERGLAPILAHEVQAIEEMAAAIQAHPTAGPLLTPEVGWPEKSLFWTDPLTGVWCRARLDWLTRPGVLRRYTIADYKTADDASPDGFARAIRAHGYDQQAAFYLDGVRALGLDDEPAWVWVVQEKAPPYLIAIYQLTGESLLRADRANRRARAVFAHCTATGEWPGYPVNPVALSTPDWHLED